MNDLHISVKAYWELILFATDSPNLCADYMTNRSSTLSRSQVLNMPEELKQQCVNGTARTITPTSAPNHTQGAHSPTIQQIPELQ